MNWLLLFVPVAVALHYALPQSQTIVFAAACLMIIPWPPGWGAPRTG